MPLRPYFKPDWYATDQETIRPIAATPGIYLDGSDFLVHRSHLPLMDTTEAARILQLKLTSDWATRDDETKPRGFTLKRTQHQAVDFIRSRRGTLLGDEMRVGKTLAAAYSHEPHLGKLVVIAPLMVREVWLSWLRRIWPGEDIGLMIGRKFDREQMDKPIVLGHYDILQGWQSGDRIGTLILDEAHGLCNRNSRRSMAAITLANCAKRVICATGTPVWNLPTGLWHVLALVTQGAFGGYHDFCMRYAKPEPTPYGTKYTGSTNGDELSLRLSEVMIRRRWVDVQDDLPPITRNTLIVDLNDAQRRRLDVQAESLRTSEKTHTAAALARYREALSHIKIKTTIAEATTCMELGEPVVIWVWHRNTARTIASKFTDGLQAFELTGDVPVAKRESIINQWRATKNGALVVTMSVAQVGIDLSHAHRAIFAEIDYTPAMISQAEMRTFAPSRAMNVSYVVADHFVDRKIVMALTRKLEAASPVDLGTGEGAISSIDGAFRDPVDEPDLDRFMADLLAG